MAELQQFAFQSIREFIATVCYFESPSSSSRERQGDKLMLKMSRGRQRLAFARKSAFVAAALYYGASPAGAAPTSQPVDPVVTHDFDEVRRLNRLGLPERNFLDRIYRDDIEHWRAAATAGDGRAAYLEGVCLSTGIGQPIETVAAVNKLDAAARSGLVEATDALALVKSLGRGTDKDPAAAFALYRKAVDAGDADAMCGLAECYAVGRGVHVDKAEAYAWCKSAAKTGLPKGNFFLANATFHGIGVPVDAVVADSLYKLAADAGYAPAIVTLADEQVAGDAGQPPDAEAAMALYRKAADAGSPGAMLRMASMYVGDKLGPRDLPAMLDCVKRAADMNDPDALRELGALYLRGLPPTLDVDYGQAVDLYRRSANEGDIVSLRWIGLAYMSGRYTTKDYGKARHFFRIGADIGDAPCMAALASTYSAKSALKGFTHDAKAQVFWLQRAVALGDASAMNDLGICYDIGDGEPRDKVEALKWFRKAALAGDASAMNNTGLEYLRGQAVSANPTEASRWFDMAARHNDSRAMVNLALLYAQGRGVPMDGRRAEELLLAAIASSRTAGEILETAQSECDLCALYLNTKAGVANPTAAQKYATLASADGSAHAWVLLGEAASSGAGFPKNDAVAFDSFQKAAAAHESVGMFKLGECYRLGTGCTADEAVAADWYHKAVDAGSSDAMDSLGLLYSVGKTRHHNELMAATWFRQALQYNNPMGIGHLAVLTGMGNGVPQDIDTATGLARRAELAGHPEFIAAIGDLYSTGCKAVAKNPPLADALYREAALYGDQKSKDRLHQSKPAPSSPTTAPAPIRSAGYGSDMG